MTPIYLALHYSSRIAIGINGRDANAPIPQLDWRINQTDKACTLRQRFNGRDDYIALPARRPPLLRQPLSAKVSSKLNAMTHGRGQSTWIFIIAPRMVWRVNKLLRPDTYDEMRVSLCERKKNTRERLAHRLDYPPLIARANATPLPPLAQSTFQICLLSDRLEKRTKNPGPGCPDD